MHRSPQELEGDAEVVAEIKILLHVDDVVAVVSVSPPQCIQNLQLDQRLLVESRNHAAKNQQNIHSVYGDNNVGTNVRLLCWRVPRFLCHTDITFM